MPYLYITLAHPNPFGKDRAPHSGPVVTKLNEEWIEFMNPTNNTVSLAGVNLYDYTFNRSCQKTGEGHLMTFTGGLEPGDSVRVHTGFGQTTNGGNRHDLHIGSGNYVWNNACGDTVVLRDGNGTVIDWASYRPNPPEGQVLRRLPNTNTLR